MNNNKKKIERKKEQEKRIAWNTTYMNIAPQPRWSSNSFSSLPSLTAIIYFRSHANPLPLNHPHPQSTITAESISSLSASLPPLRFEAHLRFSSGSSPTPFFAIFRCFVLVLIVVVRWCLWCKEVTVIWWVMPRLEPHHRFSERWLGWQRGGEARHWAPPPRLAIKLCHIVEC